jgi:hypothetical protein
MSNLPLACRDSIDGRSLGPVRLLLHVARGLSAKESPINYYT